MRRLGWMVAAASFVYPCWVIITRPVTNPRGVAGGTEHADFDDRGPGLKITHFYAATGSLVRGDHSVACYGVRNAVAVSIDPPLEPLKPARNRCIAIEPSRTTRYTLTAAGSDGRTESAAFVVRVLPPPPRIEMFAYGPKEVKSGEAVAVCYRLKNAVSARLEPVGWKLATEGRRCVQAYPPATMHFGLTAAGEDGTSDKVRFLVKVKQRK